jgi:uncharacterized membrane protein YfcA
LTTYIILLIAALLGGASNALAGGGTFIVFPALLLGGVLPVSANATASLVLMPGGFASAWVYRGTIGEVTPRFMWSMLALTVVGATLGSLLLVVTPNNIFSMLVPWLLLGATTVFTLAPWLRKMAAGASGHKSLAGLAVGQFFISVYGGYFGAGMGVLMIALYLVATKLDVHQASGLRMMCAGIVNLLTVVIFAWRGTLDYKFGIPMLILGIAGGYIGALLVKRMDANVARRAILTYAWVLTVFFFIKTFIKF